MQTLQHGVAKSMGGTLGCTEVLVDSSEDDGMNRYRSSQTRHPLLWDVHEEAVLLNTSLMNGREDVSLL